MIDIVIPYYHNDAAWDELRFALRSWQHHFKEDFRVILVGDPHPSLTGYRLIPHRRTGGRFSKVKDSIQKMDLIIRDPEISDNFIYTYDDIYLLKDIDCGWFSRIIAIEDMNLKARRENSNYRKLLWKTYDRVRAGGMHGYNYETHIPRLFNRHLLMYLIEMFSLRSDPLLIASLYYNFYHTHNPELMRPDDDIRAGFYGRVSPHGFDPRGDILDICSGKTFLNHDDAGLTKQVKAAIAKLFPNKSAFEG